MAHTPQPSNHTDLIMVSSCPEGRFGRNRQLGSSVSLAPLYPDPAAQSARWLRCNPSQGFHPGAACLGIDHRLSGPIAHAHPGDRRVAGIQNGNAGSDTKPDCLFIGRGHLCTTSQWDCAATPGAVAGRINAYTSQCTCTRDTLSQRTWSRLRQERGYRELSLQKQQFPKVQRLCAFCMKRTHSLARPIGSSVRVSRRAV